MGAHPNQTPLVPQPCQESLVSPPASMTEERSAARRHVVVCGSKDDQIRLLWLWNQWRLVRLRTHVMTRITLYSIHVTTFHLLLRTVAMRMNAYDHV